MAVTAPVSLTKIKTEFAGPNTFSSYTRGGTYVPNTPANSAISTTVANLAMSQFLNAVKFTPYKDTYTSGSDTITSPVGASSVTITLWGGGGGGGYGYSSQTNAAAGGGSGAYVVHVMSVTGGTTQFTYSVGVGMEFTPSYIESTGSTVTGPGVSLSAGPGLTGTSAIPPNAPPFAGGAGGTASGGNTVNTNGNTGYASDAGSAGADAPNGGAGGAAGVAGASSFAEATGSPGTAPGAGGGGGGGIYPDPIGYSGFGGAGARGEIWFEWS